MFLNVEMGCKVADCLGGRVSCINLGAECFLCVELSL